MSNNIKQTNDITVIVNLNNHFDSSYKISKNKCSILIEFPDFKEKYSKLYIKDVFSNEQTMRKIIRTNLNIFKDKFMNVDNLYISAYPPNHLHYSDEYFFDLVGEEIHKVIKQNR